MDYSEHSHPNGPYLCSSCYPLNMGIIHWWVTGVLIFIFSLIPPSILYLRSLYYSKNLFRPETNQLYPVTVLLPIRNESRRIESKLGEIIGLDYPDNLKKILVIVSGTDDNSETIATDYLKKNATDIDWNVEVLATPGKTLAIIHALSGIETDIFVMMDADASVSGDSLIKIMSWFQDTSIGAVCGAVSLDFVEDKEYRSRFNKIRFWESSIDSTPIFEGSLCAFRKSSLGAIKLDSSINADDSQMAINVRRNGYRAIMDPDIEFTEPLIYGKPFSRKLRRAQGLSRVFWKNRDLCMGEREYSKIFRGQFFFHLIFPWLLISSSIIILASSTHWIYSNGELKLNIFATSLVSMIVATTSKTVRQVIYGASCLIISQLFSISGKKLNIWLPDRENAN